MGIDVKWFFQVNMTPRFEALLANRVMALRRRSNVDNIRLDQTKHFLHGRKAFRNTEPLAQLLGHEQLPIADRNDLAIRNPMDCMHMLIGNFAATDDGNA